MSFGENLKFYRKRNRYSQKELALKIDVGLSTYSKYEKDEYQPKFDTLMKICDILYVSPNELLNYQRKPLTIENLDFEIISKNDNNTTTLKKEMVYMDRTFAYKSDYVIFTIKNKNLNILVDEMNNVYDEECLGSKKLAVSVEHDLGIKLLKNFNSVNFDRQFCPDNDTEHYNISKYIKLVLSLFGEQL